MKNILIILTLLSIVSCTEKINDKSQETTFKIPVIVQPSSKDTFEFFSADHIAQAFPMFIDKYKFCDTLKLPLQLEFACKDDRDVIYESSVYRSDSLMSDGYEIFTDYNSTVKRIKLSDYKKKFFYPVYVVNQTPTTKVFIGKNDYVFAIQEALDTNQNWLPIEARKHDFCGVGGWGLKVHPKECVAFLMPKYEGNYKTKIRVRIQIGDIVYVSKPFEGTINEKQFYFEKHDGYYEYYIENRVSSIQFDFFGATPLGKVVSK